MENRIAWDATDPIHREWARAEGRLIAYETNLPFYVDAVERRLSQEQRQVRNDQAMVIIKERVDQAVDSLVFRSADDLEQFKVLFSTAFLERQKETSQVLLETLKGLLI